MVREVSEETVERFRQLMLDEKPRSCHQAGVELGVSESSTGHAMNALHKRKLVFIVKYERNARVFKIGSQKDAKKPRGPDKGKREWLAREREWLKASRAVPTKAVRHPQDIALFGEYVRENA